MCRNELNQANTKTESFFYRKKKWLVFTIILAIGLVTTWYCWKNKEVDNASEVSEAYEAIVNGIHSNQPKALADAEKFSIDNKNIYGTLAALKVAQLYVEKNELDKAVLLLQQGSSAVSDDNIKSLIKLRVARIQRKQKKIDEALKTLDNIKGEDFAAIVADLRGEVLLSKGDKKGACKSWEDGVKNGTLPVLTEIMKIKINNLPLYK